MLTGLLQFSTQDKYSSNLHLIISRLQYRTDMAIHQSADVKCQTLLPNWYVFCLQMIQKAPSCLLSLTTQAAHLR